MESARPATDGDLGRLAELWGDAVAELHGQRGGGPLAGTLARPDLPAFLQGALGDADRLLVVGLVDGTSVGLASVRADRDRPDPLGELELIYVQPAVRQEGVARAMLSLVLERCSAWGMTGLDAPALPGSRSAKSFFERNGMQARMLIMHRPLGDRTRG